METHNLRGFVVLAYFSDGSGRDGPPLVPPAGWTCAKCFSAIPASQSVCDKCGVSERAAPAEGLREVVRSYPREDTQKSNEVCPLRVVSNNNTCVCVCVCVCLWYVCLRVCVFLDCFHILVILTRIRTHTFLLHRIALQDSSAHSARRSKESMCPLAAARPEHRAKVGERLTRTALTRRSHHRAVTETEIETEIGIEIEIGIGIGIGIGTASLTCSRTGLQTRRKRKNRSESKTGARKIPRILTGKRAETESETRTGARTKILHREAKVIVEKASAKAHETHIVTRIAIAIETVLCHPVSVVRDVKLFCPYFDTTSRFFLCLHMID